MPSVPIKNVDDTPRDAATRQQPVPRETLTTLAQRLFGAEHGTALDIPPRGLAPERDPPDFSGPDRAPSGNP